MKLGFVIPWYGETIGGGAESACRSIAKLLAARGLEVEVLTTCVRDFRSDWSVNHHPPGLTREGGIPVRRFPVRARNTAAFDAVNRKLLSGTPMSASEEDCFFHEMVNSPELYGYIARHAAKYLYFFIPYMFGTTVHGVKAAPDRSVLIPCLHDESYARLRTIRELFETARDVLFLSPEEEKLARRMYALPPQVGKLMGAPVDCDWVSRPSRFVQKYGHAHFLLYAGRTDAGKNADLLLDHFDRYVWEQPWSTLKLLFIGGAGPAIPHCLSARVASLGYLPAQDKYDCYGASLALCVPSVMESFSIVMMESWLARRPVIVNEHCAVTTDLCKRANGGLPFASYEEFREIVNLLALRGDMADRLGTQGEAFVRANYAPNVVAARFLNFNFLPGTPPP